MAALRDATSKLSPALSIAFMLAGCSGTLPADDDTNEDELTLGAPASGRTVEIVGTVLLYSEVPMEAQRGELRVRMLVSGDDRREAPIDDATFTLDLGAGGIPGAFAAIALDGKLATSARSFARSDQDDRFTLEATMDVPSDAARSVVRKIAGKSVALRLTTICKAGSCRLEASGVIFPGRARETTRFDLRLTAENALVVRSTAR